MAEEEKKHHHLFHRHKEEEEEGPKDPEKELKHHKHLELLGGAATIAAGAFALVCESKTHPYFPTFGVIFLLMLQIHN